MELIDYEKLDSKVLLFFDQLVEKPICFLDGADGEVSARSPNVLRLRVKPYDFEIQVLSQTAQVLSFL